MKVLSCLTAGPKCYQGCLEHPEQLNIASPHPEQLLLKGIDCFCTKSRGEYK